MARDAQVFKYSTPTTDFDKGRKTVTLCKTDRIVAIVQVIKQGGESHLHSHPHLDGVWMVISGKARFYADNDVVIGEFEKYEGVMVPRDFKYWFESIGDEPLELLQVEASDITQSNEIFTGFKGGTKITVDRLSAITRTIPG